MILRLASVLAGCLVCVGCGDNPMGPSQTSAPAPAPAPPAPPAAPAKPSPAAAAPKAGAGSPVLYDARDRAKLPPGVERGPKLAPEVEKLVLSALSPTYKTRREDCQGAEDLIFRVTASATGAFTAPATKQAAYVVASEACDAAGPGAVEATHLVIAEGDKVVAQASGRPKGASGPLPFYGTDIRAVVDLDQDGASELLVTATGAVPEGVQEFGRLYTCAGGAIKIMKPLPRVYVDGCGAGPQGKAQAQVIHYAPGTKEGGVQYSVELYEAPCPASGAPRPSDFLLVKPPAASPTPAASPAPEAPPASPAASPAPSGPPSS